MALLLRQFSWNKAAAGKHKETTTGDQPKKPAKERKSSAGKAKIPRSQSLKEMQAAGQAGQNGHSGVIFNDNANGHAVNEDVKISVFAYTYDPTIAWELLKDRHPVKSSKPLKLDTPRSANAVRFVCISDLHGKKVEEKRIPNGDVLIVAGDFTTCGHPDEIKQFNTFLGNLPHTHKIVVCGNHELTFDPILKRSNYLGFEKVFKNHSNSESAKERAAIHEALEAEHISDVRSLLTNCIYLEDCEVVINGIRIYGTPWQPAFDNWAFNLPRGQCCLDKWNLIPNGVDVLITHTPPLGYGDLTRNGVRAGCVELLNSVRKRIQPKFHIFGHIHEGYGCTSDGYTKFINACICDVNMKPRNNPIIFDFPMPSQGNQNGK